ncbi:MAG: elongation factor G [Firmicutes bacterium]|nr:elongation factor G [Bacillota bacterium]
MEIYSSEKIRNVAVVGHGGCGKTTFLEQVLFDQKLITRVGKIEDGNTVSDYDRMEIQTGHSINMTMIPVEYKDVKINFIDTPGLLDFSNEMKQAVQAADMALLVVDAGSGIQVGTEKVWQFIKTVNKPAFIMLNCKEKDEYDFDALVEEIRSRFGTGCVPASYPLKEEMMDEITELIAETDEELMEKYFEEGEFEPWEFNAGFRNGVASADIIPVFEYNPAAGQDTEMVLNVIRKYGPSPVKHAPYKYIDASGGEDLAEPEVDGPVTVWNFKTLSDPFVGKISIMKVITGTLNAGMDLINTRTGKTERLNKLMVMRGKTQMEVASACAGDIIAVSKLAYTETGDTLCEKGKSRTYVNIDIPAPTLFMGVQPKDKNDDEKMGSGLGKLREEDPSFVVRNDAETKQTLIGAQGEMQLNIIVSKLKERFGVDVQTVPRKIAYRETIKGHSDVQGKHKKQSGGAGQYGDVRIKFSPSPDQDLDFSEQLFGGSVPKQYVPAVEKGLRESMEKGPLAGFPVVNIKAVLYDGSYHDVDSNEMAFKIAASLAFKKGITAAEPVLLEPIMRLEITIPDEYMGDVMGDMNKRRARIMGMEPVGNGMQKLIAEVPMAEILEYTISLKAMTQARGSFTQEFLRYDQMPQHLANKVIEANKTEE